MEPSNELGQIGTSRGQCLGAIGLPDTNSLVIVLNRQTAQELNDLLTVVNDVQVGKLPLNTTSGTINQPLTPLYTALVSQFHQQIINELSRQP